MNFPDQSHINQVRDALWKRSYGASVMVGAGFSRNASSTSPNNDIPPTLPDLAQSISDKLYPQGGLGRRENASADLSASASFRSLAQKYEVAFGRDSLHQLLQSLVRDTDLRPSSMHSKLLSLPWRDVFTTNWDTLLERSLPSVLDRKYSVLRNKDEIPLAGQPRIVKLHGSFPAQFPLICTEEDYRTYPIKFAPFVNTIRQAMMETVFLLVGFSGDDPNFIQWTGWVRDNLCESAPKLYLAGWLSLSPHQRRMLEHQNVVPIDLACHPQAGKWPEHQRHHYTMHWILHTLEQGCPDRITAWPAPRAGDYMQIPADLQPVVKIDSDEPREEPWFNSESESIDVSQRIDAIIRIWAHNRRLYPGWLAVPVSVQRTMSRITDGWEPGILSTLSNFEPLQQLEAIYELVWRREVLLDPISSELELAAQQVLQKIDCQARIIDGLVQTEVKWINVRKIYRNVALALVTVARHHFDHETFKDRIKALQHFRKDHPDVEQRIHHEQCLWAFYSMDYKLLSNLLSDWPTENCDPIWMIRKAVLLFETNRIADARKLSALALEAIRSIPSENRSVAGPSRESCSLDLVFAIESISCEQPFEPSRYYRRWRELASEKCDLLSEIQGYADLLAPARATKDAPAFDFGFRAISGFRISNTGYRRVVARRAIRLSEVAGLPTSNIVKILKLAADELSVREPEMAIRLILRTVNSDGDDDLKRILSRTRVAVMPVNLADKLAKICIGLIEYALPRIGGSDVSRRPRFWIERMRVALEVLSRLVVRLDPNSVEKQFNMALDLYRHPPVVNEPWLHTPVRNTLTRSWRSLPEQRRTACLLDLLGAPILGIDQSTPVSFIYPDVNKFQRIQTSPPNRTNNNEGRWQHIVSQLVQGLKEGGKVRERASFWVSKLSLWKRLNEAETANVAQALWSEEFVGSYGMPRQTSLLDWVFMVLPEPKLGLAEQRFRSQWLAASLLPQEKAPAA